MDIDEQTRRIREARALIAPLIAQPLEPQIEAILRSAAKGAPGFVAISNSTRSWPKGLH